MRIKKDFVFFILTLITIATIGAILYVKIESSTDAIEKAITSTIGMKSGEDNKQSEYDDDMVVLY